MLTFTGWGTVTVTANQAGNTDYTAAAPVTQTIIVTQPPVSTNVVLSLSNEVFTYPGEANVTVCVSVTSNVAATGMMQIFDNGVLLTTQPLQGGGCAYWYIQPGLNAGPHAFSAYYLGDSVNPPGYSNTVASMSHSSRRCLRSTAGIRPSRTAQTTPAMRTRTPARCKATLSTPSTAHPRCMWLWAATTTRSGPSTSLPVGNYTMTIDYPQQGTTRRSLCPRRPIPSPRPLMKSPSRPRTGARAQAAASPCPHSVTSQSAGAPNAIGSVSFYDGSTLLAAVPVDSNGNANFTTTFTSGYHNLTATYSGANYSTNSTTINLQVQ